MTWIKRAQPPAHVCEPPSRIERGYVGVPSGAVGDLWRCDDCRALWRVSDACDLCDLAGEWPMRDGHHVVGSTWRRATLWQRLTNWRR